MKIKNLFHFNSNAHRTLGNYLQHKNVLAFMANFVLNSLYHTGKRLKIKKYRHKKYKVNNSIKLVKHKLVFPIVQQPLVSIVIPVYNQYKYTLNCLHSILNSHDKTPYEIIIADDCSNDLTKNLESIVKGTIILHNKSNLGYIRNCNNAAKYAKGTYIYFLNNDTKVEKHWLETMVNVFKLRKNVGVVGSLIIRPNGLIQECGGYLFNNFVQTYGFNSPNDPKFNYLKKCDYVSGCSLLTPKKLFDQINGFDERYAPAYSDDSDYCLSVKKNGYDIYVQPKSKILHYESITYSEKSATLMKENNIKLKTKWHDFFSTRTNYDCAKDETSNKRAPTLLLIDDLFPQFDKHAGGKTIYNFLEVLSSMNLNIKFCPKFAYGIEEKYYSILNDMGIETIMPERLDGWIKEHNGLIDYLFLSRPQIAENFLIKSLRKHGIKVLYYGHDLHFLRMQRSAKYNTSITTNDINDMEKLEKTIINCCDIAFYPSDIETNFIKTQWHLTNVQTIPPYAYNSNALPNHLDFEHSSGIIFVGSSHGPNLDGLCWFINSVFPIILKKIPNLILYIVGDNSGLPIFLKNHRNIKILKLLSQSSLDNIYSKTRISIVPLRYGAGIKGKLIDALYHRVPVISTSCGIEGINNDFDLISISDSETGFANAVIELYTNKEKWERTQQNFSNFIEKYFSYEKICQILSTHINKEPRDN